MTLAQSLVRFRLTFVQLGASFEPMRSDLLAGIGATECSVSELVNGDNPPETTQKLVVTDLERSLDDERSPTLGSLRSEIMKRIDAGQNICLVSRAPRCAYAAVPGSSILEDCAFVAIPILDGPEIGRTSGPQWSRSWRLPSISLVQSPPISELLAKILTELGPAVLSALDHALFEVDPRSTVGLTYLSDREQEALRSAGVIMPDTDSGWVLVVSEYLKELKEVLSDLISQTTVAQADLRVVVEGLWYIERTVRAETRKVAVSKWGNTWRNSVLGGEISQEVLRRAQLDGLIGSTKVGDLRDPLEWLTLGELVDLVKSEKFTGLGKSPVLWRRLQEQLIPVRNRLAHVRMLKASDAEHVTTWVGAVRTWF